ncbi:MAG: tRNA pseudouridine synthase A, partial [Acidobacteriota bacterium]
ALGRVLGEAIQVVGSGRTDAGVHARGQVANFLTGNPLAPGRLRRAVNSFLPPDIRVHEVEEVAADFHACRDAIAKLYVYRMGIDEVLSPFQEPFVHQIRGGLVIPPMRRAAREYLGEHDFTSFCAAETRVRSRVRKICESSVDTENGPGILAYRVVAGGFLQHMVRTLAGTLLDVGKGRLEPEAIPEILAKRDRRSAGPCAPAKGLTLEWVHYQENR